MIIRGEQLFVEAVTHSSFRAENGGRDNERLEFLGDSVLQLCVSEMLYQRFPGHSEGALSQVRKRVVNNRFLAEIARDRGLGLVLRLGKGEHKTGGADKHRVLAGAVEAILGAIYLVEGLEEVRTVVRALIEPAMMSDTIGRSDKAVLHEWAQATYKLPPEYHSVAVEGPDHARRYTERVVVDGQTLAEGAGASIKQARKAAASAAITALGIKTQR